MRRCAFNTGIIMHRTRGFSGPFFQSFNGVCVKSVGNAYAAGGPLAGPKPIYGTVLTDTTAELTFSQCVEAAGGAVSPYGLSMTIDGVPATFTASISDSVISFSSISPAIQAGDEVLISYADPGLVDCKDGDPIDEFTDFRITNPLVLAGDFILLETGGSDIVLLEDDATLTDGIQLENAP